MNFWNELKIRLASIRSSEEEIHPHIADVASKLPPTPEGHTRLYRIEDKPTEKVWPPAEHWLHSDPEFQKKQEARGRWYTPHLPDVQWYGQHANANSIPSQMRYLDVPHNVAQSSSVANLPKGMGTASFYSRRPDKENFIPKELKSKSQIVPGYDYTQLPGGDFKPSGGNS